MLHYTTKMLTYLSESNQIKPIMLFKMLTILFTYSKRTKPQTLNFTNKTFEKEHVLWQNRDSTDKYFYDVSHKGGETRRNE